MGGEGTKQQRITLLNVSGNTELTGIWPVILIISKNISQCAL